jgi:3',5'-cyclic-AMP phosphodiesterase
MTNRRVFFKSLGLGGAIPFLAYSKSSTPLRFAIASDGHYGQEQTAYEMYFEHMVRWLNMEKENNGLDLAIFNGDLIHDKPDFLTKVKHSLDQLLLPYWVVRGNHDQVTLQHWQATWGYPTNHVFECKGYAFVLADTSNQDGLYKCADLKWLEQALDTTRNKKGVFVFLHISQSDWTTHGVHCPEVMNLLTGFDKVKAVFHGHDHQEDHVKYFHKKPFLYSGHFGGSWGVEYKGYRIVEAMPDDTFITFQYNPQANAQLYPITIY